MNSHLKALLLGMAQLVLPTAQAAGTCQGAIPNPVTDVCWSCMLPLTIGSVPVNGAGQEDLPNPGETLCQCGSYPFVKYGVWIGFWEPARVVEVTRTPWCFPALGGLQLAGTGAPAQPAVSYGGIGRRASQGSFYHAHWYRHPLLAWMGMLDTSCAEKGGGAPSYVTELDPAWNDPELAQILHPEVFLAAAPQAQAACALDCAAANSGFGLPAMSWCAGCQGSSFPWTGHVQSHVGGIEAGALLLQRYAMKIHRTLAELAGHGRAGRCGHYPHPQLDKRIYKATLLWPQPQAGQPGARCCQPLGRSTQLWAAGRPGYETGGDTAWLLYRKRNCCETGW